MTVASVTEVEAQFSVFVKESEKEPDVVTRNGRVWQFFRERNALDAEQ